MSTYRGRFLARSEVADFSEHRVEVWFNEIINLDQPQTTQPSGGDNETHEPESLLVQTIRSALVYQDGSFTITLPPEIDEPITVKLKAPGGEILFQQEITLGQLDGFQAQVDPAPASEIEPHPDPHKGLRVKLTGRVLDEDGPGPLASLQIIIWARPPHKEAFRPVASSLTDKSGYFTTDYPRGRFTEAYGQVLQAGNHRVPIPLESDGSFPEHIVLILSLGEAREQLANSQRQSIPQEILDPVDMVNSPGAYSTVDVGGGKCVDFTVPNRTLEEFSYYKIVRTTEPEIKGTTLSDPGTIPKVLLEALQGLSTKVILVSSPTVPDSLSHTEINSGSIGGATIPITDIPNLASNTEIARNATLEMLDTNLLDAINEDLFTPYDLMTDERRARFDHITDLIKAMNKKFGGRAPLDIDNPIDWDSSPTFYQATTIAHGHILHFKQIWRADGYSLGDLLYSLPLAPCQKKQIAIIDWERRERTRRDQIDTAEERLLNSLSRDRDIAEIVRATAFEQLEAHSEASMSSWAAGGGIGLALGPVVIGAGGGGGGSSASSSAWQESSRQISGSSLQQLRDRTHQAAQSVRSRRATVVQAVRQGETMQIQTEVVANNNHCHAMTVQYFEVLRHFLVTQELVEVRECLFIPLLMSSFDSSKALRWREPLSRYLRDRRLQGGFNALERARFGYEGTNLPTSSYADDEIQYIDGELRISFVIARPRDIQDDEVVYNYVMAAWGPISILLGGNPADWYRRYQERQQDLAPRLAKAFTSALKISLVDSNGLEHPIDLDPTLLSDYQERVPLYVRLNSRGTIPTLRRNQITGIHIRTEHELPPGSKVIVESAFFRYRTIHLNHYLHRNDRVKDDLLISDDVYLSTPLDRIELRNPRKEDRLLSRRLLKHLNEHLEYYHRMIWLSMDAERRYMLLDGIEAPNTDGRSVASVVENQLISIVGNCLILPVADGYNLDPTYRTEDGVSLLDAYAPLTPPPPSRISIPTKGVFAEAVMGKCNSCEPKDESRFWRWEESPCPDDPTPIDKVSADSRRSAPPELHPEGFPSPIIAMQNAPAAPDPNGLTATLQVLSNPNLFRDITGLTENQRNALTALQQAFDTAQSFGIGAMKEATKLAALDKTTRKIRSAKEQGLIDENQAKQLTKKAIESVIDDDRQDPEQVVGSIQNAVESGLIDKEQGSLLTADAFRRLIHGASAPAATPLSTEDVQELARFVKNSGTPVNMEFEQNREGYRLRVEPALYSENASEVVSHRKRCGISAQDRIIPVYEVGQRLAEFAQEERTVWLGRAENDNTMYGHLLCFWSALEEIWRTATTRNDIIDFWDDVKNMILRNENDESGYDRTEIKRRINQHSLQIETDRIINKADRSRDNIIPWSAAFIYYCIRKAQIELGVETSIPTREKLLRITQNGRHADYLLGAIERKRENIGGTFHAFEPNEREPQIGDIIIQDRTGRRAVNGIITLSRIQQRVALHGDIVVSVENNYVETIGGNLSHSVKRRRYPRDEHGFLYWRDNNTPRDERTYVYLEESNSGDFTDMPSNLGNWPEDDLIDGSSQTIRSKSTHRIFALLSLVEECIEVTDWSYPLSGDTSTFRA